MATIQTFTITDNNDGSSNDVTVVITDSNGTATYHLPLKARTGVLFQLYKLCEETGVRVS